MNLLREKRVTRIEANALLTDTSKVMEINKETDYVNLPSIIRDRKKGTIKEGQIDIEVIGLTRGVDLLCEDEIIITFYRFNDRLMSVIGYVNEIHEFGIGLEVLKSFFNHRGNDYIVEYDDNRIWKNGDIIFPKENK